MVLFSPFYPTIIIPQHIQAAVVRNKSPGNADAQRDSTIISRSRHLLHQPCFAWRTRISTRCRYARLLTSSEIASSKEAITEICGLPMFDCSLCILSDQPVCRSMPNFQVVQSLSILDSAVTVMTSSPVLEPPNVRRIFAGHPWQRSARSNGTRDHWLWHRNFISKRKA